MLLNIIFDVFSAVLVVYALRNLIYALFHCIGRKEKKQQTGEESQNQDK